MAYGRRAIWFCGESVKGWVGRHPFWIAISIGVVLLVVGISLFLTFVFKQGGGAGIPASVSQTVVPSLEPSLRPTLVPWQQPTRSPISKPTPALQPSPGYLPCAICGEGFQVGAHYGMMVLPEFSLEEIPCMLGEFAGMNGYVPPDQCEYIMTFYTGNCGCKIAASFASEAPSVVPSTPPSVALPTPAPFAPVFFLNPTQTPAASGSGGSPTLLPKPPQATLPTPPPALPQTTRPTELMSPGVPSPSPTPLITPSPTPTPTFGSDPLDPPSTLGTTNPTSAPSPSPIATRPSTPMPVTLAQTLAPTPAPTRFQLPNATGPTLTEFCVIADVPYTRQEERELKTQLATLPAACEFIVHLGDIQKGDISCTEDRYDSVNAILNKSSIPMFMVLGDNEWNDCPAGQREMGWDNWNEYFLRYDRKYWNHNYQVVEMDGHGENYYFVHHRTLFIGLNLVGGAVYPNRAIWDDRLAVAASWVKNLMSDKLPTEASGVVIMAHCQVEDTQNPFFDPVRDFIQFTLKNRYPILYIHGDGHEWIHTTNFFNQGSYVRIQTSGGTNDPVLLMRVDPHNHLDNANAAFGYNRRL